MKSTSNSREKKDKSQYWFWNTFFIYSTCIAAITTIFALHLIFHHPNIKYPHYFEPKNSFIHPNNNTNSKPLDCSAEIETCDLSEGQWIPHKMGPSLYTNYSCTTIPFLRNCFLHGRKDSDFLHWRWKPVKCDLPRFRQEYGVCW